MQNTLYYGDNLKVLREYITDESIDLIYLDPPFNSKADYNILFKEPTGQLSGAQITAFEDTWHWTEKAEETFQEIVTSAPAEVVEMMTAFRQFVGLNDVMAYLTMICIRLLELRRILKPTGSIYLHCDPTASHYLKIIMDVIFGKRCFRNEIAWCYRKWSAAQNQFVRNHDTILFYTKSPENIHAFNTLYVPVSPGTMKRWKGQRQQAVFDEKGVRRASSLEGKQAETPMPDWWEISIINPAAKERMGYPTQKPEALLGRIIQASSNEGDLVLDPFCGCGTTIAVAQKLKRYWVGIDVTHLAINLIKGRLRDAFGLEPKKDYAVIGEPEDLEGARNLAKENRYQFQWWALSLIPNAKPYGDKKKGADTGIDGYLYFAEESNKVERVIIQVKSGHVTRTQITELRGVIEREKAAMGLLITLEEPTGPMEKEAIGAGNYKSPLWGAFPKMQICTIESLLAGQKPKLPYGGVLPPYKRAERQKAEDKCKPLEFD